MAAYIQQDNSRRAVVFVAAVLFHILIAYFIASGLARKAIDTIAAPLVTDIVEEVKEKDKPPPPPPPEMVRPPVEVPPPEVSIDVPVETNSTAITDVTDKPQPKAPPPPPPKGPSVAPKLDVKHSPSTDDYYPPSARRAEIQGVTTVLTCVSPDGKTSGEPTVTATSGNSSLDEAALKWTKRARFSPGTEDGKAIQMCMQFKVRFKLTE